MTVQWERVKVIHGAMVTGWGLGMSIWWVVSRAIADRNHIQQQCDIFTVCVAWPTQLKLFYHESQSCLTNNGKFYQFVLL